MQSLQGFAREYSPRNTTFHLAPLSLDFSQVCSTLFGVTRITFTRFNILSPFGPRLMPSNSAAGCDLARREYMNPTFVVGEHAVPALVIRTVSEDVLTIVAPSAVPVLDYQTLVKRQTHSAVSIRRRALGANHPIAEPIIKLPVFRTRSARIVIRGSKAACREREGEQNGENEEFGSAAVEHQF